MLLADKVSAARTAVTELRAAIDEHDHARHDLDRHGRVDRTQR